VETKPFANDLYDAVGSIAIQVAWLVALISYARVIRWQVDLRRHPWRFAESTGLLVGQLPSLGNGLLLMASSFR
jgi:hypothetical protein